MVRRVRPGIRVWSGATHVSRWVGLVLRLVCEVLVSVSCVSRLPPVSLNRYRMVVRFVRVIRLPACARVSRVSRVCPGSPGVFLPVQYSTGCLFTGTGTKRKLSSTVHYRYPYTARFRDRDC